MVLMWPPEGRGRKDPPRPPRSSAALLTPRSGLLASRTERISLSCFKPPRLWCFVTTTTGNSYGGQETSPAQTPAPGPPRTEEATWLLNA